MVDIDFWLGITDVGSETLRFPQAIAHRGWALGFFIGVSLSVWLTERIGGRFKVQFPENTLIAFEGAVKAGAHAIETGGLTSIIGIRKAGLLRFVVEI